MRGRPPRIKKGSDQEEDKDEPSTPENELDD